MKCGLYGEEIRGQISADDAFEIVPGRAAKRRVAGDTGICKKNIKPDELCLCMDEGVVKCFAVRDCSRAAMIGRLFWCGMIAALRRFDHDIVLDGGYVQTQSDQPEK